MHQDKISINRLSVHTKIGVHASEQIYPQLLLIDIELTTDFSKAFLSDALKDTIDYNFINQHVKEYCQSNRFALIESLAGGIISEIFSIVNTSQVSIKIRKPSALSSGALASVFCVRTRDEIKDNYS